MVLSLSKREKLFIMKLNSLMDSSLTEDISHLTLLLTKKNKKLNLKTAIFYLSRKNLATFVIFYLSSSLLIKNKNLFLSLLKILRANSLLDLSSTDSKITLKFAQSKLHLSEITENRFFKILLFSQEEDSSVKKLVLLFRAVQAQLKKLN